MKQTRRRFLSLLMAFAILCTMIPAAFAAEGDWTNWTGGGEEASSCEHKNVTTATTKTPTCTETGVETQTCTTCGAIRTKEIAKKEHSSADDKWYYEKSDNNQHTKYQVCQYCKERINSSLEAHTYSDTWSKDQSGHWHECTACGAKTDEVAHVPSTNLENSQDGTKHVTKCTVCGYEISAEPHKWIWTNITETTHSGRCETPGCNVTITNEAHTFGSDGKCTLCGAQNSGKVMSVDLAISGSSTIGVGEKASFKVTAYSDTNKTIVTKYDNSLLAFEASNSNVRISGTDVIGRYPGTVQVRAIIDGQQSNWVTLTVKATKDLEVTISQSLETYSFGDSDTLKGDSLYDQLDDALDEIADYRDYSNLKFTISGGNSSIGTIDDSKLTYVDEFDKVEFTIKKVGTFSADYTVKEGSTTVLSGKIVITVEEGAASAGDVIYTAIMDKDVSLNVKDFENFWEGEYSKGTLKYVNFGSVSSRQGSLVDGGGHKITTRDKCYVDPGKNDIDLDSVSFEPKSGFTGPVTIDFTAYGTTSSSSKTTKELKGTLVILYTKNEPKAISYSVSDKPVTLDGDDFLANYKDAMGTTAKTLQIKFLDVPTNGTLYYKYNEKTEKGTELTKKNIDSYLFSTNSKASKALADVTYVPDSKGRSDTVKFACYDSSGNLCYYGEVTFGVTVKEVTVSLSSTSAGVTFNSADFFGASSDMLAVTYLTFGTPSNGTLYKNWTGVTGTKVATTDKFSYVASVTGYTSLSTVTYVPTAGYSGTVTIPFSAFTASGTVINGTVSIKVTATSTVVFTDVPTTGSQSWAYPYITRLASAGVVGGITPTTYGPKQQVKWGEVLKMVLLGAGHPAQTEGTGANWAANYLTYAYQKGIVSSDKIDLSKPITRVEMAELAAKALGLSAETSIKIGIIGPTDTTNGYVYALYNRGIVGGDSSSGKNLYNPNSTLLRDEMAKIVCGVMDSAK